MVRAARFFDCERIEAAFTGSPMNAAMIAAMNESNTDGIKNFTLAGKGVETS